MNKDELKEKVIVFSNNVKTMYVIIYKLYINNVCYNIHYY